MNTLYQNIARAERKKRIDIAEIFLSEIVIDGQTETETQVQGSRKLRPPVSDKHMLVGQNHNYMND